MLEQYILKLFIY